MLRKREPISNEVKRAVWDKSDGRCWYCGKRLNPFFTHYDHFEPHSKGGEDTVENLVLACPPCNHSKRDMAVWEWKCKISQELGISVSRQQINMMKSEGIDYFENTYAYEPPILFYFERDYFKGKTPDKGWQKVYNVINYGGWTR
jgi:hypothetical protein